MVSNVLLHPILILKFAVAVVGVDVYVHRFYHIV